ncbi:hypothetical protein K450DRAFT_238689 [Umbelopsis ramanniana AG]|uniref:Uncharacterized protein n=1 Tax=Umbelopsis ramanniana AG TaxID=1314678 RepID=A0AAD5EC00_UMBRA|nr:uncharacterized protein K450DRAFT_238689 [Umbelopsis ramanniana AG]KAI8580211.1 hypothetical protein K450DRAFT_238689 [Umbelopsis ramanniana AG]
MSVEFNKNLQIRMNLSERTSIFSKRVHPIICLQLVVLGYLQFNIFTFVSLSK